MRKFCLLAIILILSCPTVGLAKVIKQYYPNGTLKYVANYNNKNQLNGPYKFYWPGGQLKEEGRYKNDKHVGKPKRYSPDGELLNQ